ncbi:MAG: hypothetical protein ACFE7E_00095 [Candidatus Hodarchaeota archaeon]
MIKEPQFIGSRRLIKYSIEDMVKRRPKTQDEELKFTGLTVAITYALNILPEPDLLEGKEIESSSEGMFDFKEGKHSSVLLERRLENHLHWGVEKIKILKRIFGKEWDIFWKGLTGDVDRIDRIVFTPSYLDELPLIHFEFKPISVQKWGLKRYMGVNQDWRDTGTKVNGYVRRFATLYRTGFLTLSYIFIFTSKRREWLKDISHLSSDNHLTTDEIIYLLTAASKGFLIPFKEGGTSLGKLAFEDATKIINRLYDWGDKTSSELAQILQDSDTTSYFSISIWDAECGRNEILNDAVSIIRNHPWELYGLRGPDRNWRTRDPEYIQDYMSTWFNPYSDVAFKAFPRVHLEISFPLVKRIRLIASGPTSPPFRLWEFRVLQERIFRSFDHLLRNEESKLARSVKGNEYVDAVTRISGLRRRLVSVLGDNYWIMNDIKHLPDRDYFIHAQQSAGIRRMRKRLMEKFNVISNAAENMVNVVSIQSGERMSEVRTYTSILGIFLAAILTMAGAVSNYFIWTISLRVENLSIIDHIISILGLLGINAVLFIPVLFLLLRYLKGKFD